MQGLLNDSLYLWRKKSWDQFLQFDQQKQKKELPLPASDGNPFLGTFLPDCRYRCVFVDGFFKPEESHLPESIVCLPLEQAIRSYNVFLQNRINRALKEEKDLMAILNGAFQGRGVLLYIPPQFEMQDRMEICHYFTSEHMASARIHLFMGHHSHLEIVQTIQSKTDRPFCNFLFDAVLDEKSRLNLYDAVNLPEHATYFQSIRAHLKKESTFFSCSLMNGAKQARTSVKVQLAEEQSEAILQGLAQLENERQNEIQITVDHIAAHTRSKQNFKAILYDKSKSSFEGKILVQSKAQKTDAYQRSAHLPLSLEAISSAKPNLEIFADDVKASHGATVAQISPDDLFYLRTRGLSLELARQWLIRGFCSDILKLFPIDSLKKGFIHEHP